MTRRRLDRISRIVGVQSQMKRAAEWRLHDLRRQESEMRASQHDVLSSLGRDDALVAALAPVLSRRLCSLAAQVAALAAKGDRQAELVLEQTVRLTYAEGLQRAAGGELERACERADLEDLGGVVARGSAGATLR